MCEKFIFLLYICKIASFRLCALRRVPCTATPHVIKTDLTIVKKKLSRKKERRLDECRNDISLSSGGVSRGKLSEASSLVASSRKEARSTTRGARARSESFPLEGTMGSIANGRSVNMRQTT